MSIQPLLNISGGYSTERYIRSNKQVPRIIDIDIFADHPIFHASDEEISSAIDLSKYQLPQGDVIAKDKNRITSRMVCDFEEFAERIEDLCEDDYGLVMTYKNISDDHSHYYNYLATDSNGNIVVDLRLRLRIANHDPKSSPEQKKHKKEELASPKLHELLPEYAISKLTKYPKIIIVNDELYSSYEEAFEEVNDVISEAVQIMLKNENTDLKFRRNI